MLMSQHTDLDVQAAFGKNLLGITSFLTYVGLGLGFLGSGLALPFGIFVLLCQRDPEKNLQVCLRIQRASPSETFLPYPFILQNE